MWRYPEGRLLVFAKAPVTGKVKTRLRRRWGAAGARRIYMDLCRRTLNTARASAAAPVELWCSPGIGHPWLRARAREAGAALRVQPPGDLGRRMHRALAASLRDAPYAVIIGADCAGLTPEHIHAAFERLADGQQAVFCPAPDGGYVLVGTRYPEPGVFRTVPWGTDAVMQATRQRLRRLGLHYAELDPALDVDRPADVHRLRRGGLLPAWPGAALARARGVVSPAGSQYPGPSARPSAGQTRAVGSCTSATPITKDAGCSWSVTRDSSAD
ncbi:TIGR04282 family arsenosugar biosynthesis glycosyltransferase [Aquisalimonas sp.]|uniref:TIGR04282 family arsenosugar biosynthesis glycosyltransferase n=1 Tax=Aquisalimonas sp. TaxID=1872621 RepID=UPI0025BD0855|nr:TIGR04282 family arsenosugar biosynthesis glycosyltransferase [Aquisalimonas sp.]